MCGIVGQIRYRSPVDADLLVRQRDSLIHRGPDSAGSWLSDDRRVGLAHRRLAIIDLSPGGHQPMVDADSGNVISFNGEIYNFQAVRQLLEAGGAQFRTHSDTEVVLAAYREWGIDCIRRLDGMFALAIFDAKRNRVVLARDRAGEKPLYIWETTEGISFASELKALLVDPELPRVASRTAINEFLAYGYATAPSSLLSGVRKLLPGTVLVVDLDSATVTESRYWDLPSPNIDAERLPQDELVDRLEAALVAAVRGQLLADVPVGVLLSGGVDSSIIAALAASVSSSRIRTFTARFPQHADVDEGPYARLVATHIDSEHIELDTSPPNEDTLRELVEQFDDPIADSSLIPTYLLSREIRKHATVAIGGDGGDELFGGYRHYSSQLAWSARRQRLPRVIASLAASIGTSVLHEDARGINSIRALTSSDEEIVAMGGRLFRPGARARILGDTFSLSEITQAEAGRTRLTYGTDDMIGRSTSADFRSYMVDDVLVKVDRASMLTSLEVRAPFLDRAVIEFAFGTLSSDQKVSARGRKLLLRRLGERLLPSSLDLTRKQGFDIPLSSWLTGPWLSIIQELENFQSTLLRINPIRELRKQAPTSSIACERLFAIAMLLLWEQHYAITGAK